MIFITVVTTSDWAITKKSTGKKYCYIAIAI